MSRKDYSVMASFMFAQWLHINQDDDEVVNAFYEGMSKLGDAYLEDNPRFSREKFEWACTHGEGR